MSEHIKLTKLERLPRAAVWWFLVITVIPLWVVLIPIAIAWNYANDIGEAVLYWSKRMYWK